MILHKHVIIGCGDVGQRIAAQLIASGIKPSSITGMVRSAESVAAVKQVGVNTQQCNFDQSGNELSQLHQASCYYLVPPQKSGITDQRTYHLLAQCEQQNITPNRVVLISTTGVYGDCDGEWVTEQSTTKPLTERGQRRLHSEQQWLAWAQKSGVPIAVLRVPGIYANSRIPRARILNRTPVVNPNECGFSNRIHADDLALVSIVAMASKHDGEIYNATDGSPGKISEYLQAAAAQLGEPALPQISMAEARDELSAGMLSYLGESRKISNQKMLEQLNVVLHYPDYIEGLKFG